jgi:hypothetical protein
VVVLVMPARLPAIAIIASAFVWPADVFAQGDPCAAPSPSTGSGAAAGSK